MSDQLPVMETFLSLQGEGHHQGTLAYFIRLAGCDVGCPWCDVKESWEVNENQWRTVSSLIDESKASGAPAVIITGGEPLMYDLTLLTQELKKNGLQVHIETSGAYPFTGSFDWITLSPKKFKKTLAEFYTKADELKVIIASKKDLEFAEEEAAKVSPECKLFLQSEWDRKDKQYPRIYSYIVDHPAWKISLQTHKYLNLP